MRHRLGTRPAVTALTAGTGLAAVAVALRRRRVSMRARDDRDWVLAEREPVGTGVFDPGDVADLPSPVRRYFETVLESGQAYVETVRLSQRGEFRLGGADAPWYPFTASGAYSVLPPGFVWDASIALFPGVSVRVLDAYVRGEGRLRADLFGAVPVASAGPDPAMNEAELQRYLSETPWFPTALLPAAGVTWTAIDDRSARATVTDGAVTATAVFHFDEAGYVRRLTADRYRQDIDAMAPWTGHYRGYEERSGMAVPTVAEVGWDSADSVVPYWRGTVTDVEYVTGR